jgi:hypothetical protein
MDKKIRPGKFNQFIAMPGRMATDSGNRYNHIRFADKNEPVPE